MKDLKSLSERDLYAVAGDVLLGHNGLYGLEEIYDPEVSETTRERIVVSEKSLRDEFKRRKLPFPLSIIPAPKTIIIDVIEVPKVSSKIVTLDAKDVKNPKDVFAQYHNHPMQGRVLAFDPGIEWDSLYLGCIVYLKNFDFGVYKEAGADYGYIFYSNVIGIK